MWMASCASDRDWAIFVGPDGSAQVRDCKDVGAGSGLPALRINERPKGSLPTKKGLSRGSLIAAGGFLILAGRRLFLDRHAIALADFLAPAAVRIGHAVRPWGPACRPWIS